MTDREPPADEPVFRPGGLARAGAALFGFFLLFPGLCALGAMGAFLPQYGVSGSLVDAEALGLLTVLWLVCFGLSWYGFGLIRRARRDAISPGDRLIGRIALWTLALTVVAGVAASVLR